MTTWVTARIGARNAERVAETSAAGAERLARQERRELRGADAYVEVLAPGRADTFTLRR